VLAQGSHSWPKGEATAGLTVTKRKETVALSREGKPAPCRFHEKDGFPHVRRGKERELYLRKKAEPGQQKCEPRKVSPKKGARRSLPRRVIYAKRTEWPGGLQATTVSMREKEEERRRKKERRLPRTNLPREGAADV